MRNLRTPLLLLVTMTLYAGNALADDNQTGISAGATASYDFDSPEVLAGIRGVLDTEILSAEVGFLAHGEPHNSGYDGVGVATLWVGPFGASFGRESAPASRYGGFSRITSPGFLGGDILQYNSGYVQTSTVGALSIRGIGSFGLDMDGNPVWKVSSPVPYGKLTGHGTYVDGHFHASAALDQRFGKLHAVLSGTYSKVEYTDEKSSYEPTSWDAALTVEIDYSEKHRLSLWGAWRRLNLGAGWTYRPVDHLSLTAGIGGYKTDVEGVSSVYGGLAVSMFFDLSDAE